LKETSMMAGKKKENENVRKVEIVPVRKEYDVTFFKYYLFARCKKGHN